MRNLIRRGRIWYFKKMVDGRLKPVSLATEDVELAKAKRNALEADALKGEWEKVQGPRALRPGTLADVFGVYELAGGLTGKPLRANMSSLLMLCRVGLGQPGLEAKDVPLDWLTRRLVRNYQDRLRKQYEEERDAEGRELDEKGKRMARDRADRTSKSTFNQAKSLFARKRDLIGRYREAGINVPACVEEFATAGAVGKMTSKVYFPPSDAILRETFERIEELRESECAELEAAYFLFWGALATGCRRNELADMRVADLVELDGRLWVGAGLGKDGMPIRIPVIDWEVRPAGGNGMPGPPGTPAARLRELLEAAQAAKREYLFAGGKTERYDELPDRLNAWMRSLGWADEKVLHALRAYIGCKIYARNPRLAQLYLRHKSIATTEKFYGHFLTLNGAFEFESEKVAPVLAVVQASGQAA